MHTIYLSITAVAALANGYAASLNFIGAESVRAVADRVHVAQRWMIPLGVVLAAGAAGLLAGMAWPVLGTAAAIGLILYFVCALVAHVRAGDRGIGGAVSFLALAVAALIADVAYRSYW